MKVIMTKQAFVTDTYNRHAAYVNKHIVFDPVTGLPCLLATWSNTIGEVIELAQERGLEVQMIKSPVVALEIVGQKTRIIVRDHSLAAETQPQRDGKQLGLYDQMCIFEHESMVDSWCFVQALFHRIEKHGHTISDYNVNRVNHVRHFAVRTPEYTLVCVIGPFARFPRQNADVVDTILHWSLLYGHEKTYPRKGESDYKVENSHVPDGTAHP